MKGLFSDGIRDDSGSLIGSVSAFGAVAPTSRPSSSPAADMEMATRGRESLLQASLRITVLMIRSIGPVPSTGRYIPGCSADVLASAAGVSVPAADVPAPAADVPAPAADVPAPAAGPADPGGSAGWTGTCVTWAVPPYFSAARPCPPSVGSHPKQPRRIQLKRPGARWTARR